MVDRYKKQAGMNSTSVMAELTNVTSEPASTLLTEDEPERVLHLDLYYYKLSADLFIAIDPIITFGGLLGNILIMMVMQRQALRPTSFALYMTALAVSDTLVLVLDFINNWFKMELDIYLLGMSDGFCKFHRFFFNVCYNRRACKSVCWRRYFCQLNAGITPSIPLPNHINIFPLPGKS